MKESEYTWIAHGFTDSIVQGDLFADLQWSLCITCAVWIANQLFDILAYDFEIDSSKNQVNILNEILEIYRGLSEFFLLYMFPIETASGSSQKKKVTYHTGPTTSPENSYHINYRHGKSLVDLLC
jgi:hypothetical protein